MPERAYTGGQRRCKYRAGTIVTRAVCSAIVKWQVERGNGKSSKVYNEIGSIEWTGRRSPGRAGPGRAELNTACILTIRSERFVITAGVHGLAGRICIFPPVPLETLAPTSSSVRIRPPRSWTTKPSRAQLASFNAHTHHGGCRATSSRAFPLPLDRALSCSCSCSHSLCRARLVNYGVQQHPLPGPRNHRLPRILMDLPGAP